MSNEIVNESSDSYRIIWVVKVCISHNFTFTLNVFRQTIFFFKISDCKIGNCKWRSKFGWRLSVDHERHRQRVSGWLRKIKINYFNLLSGVFILNLVKPSVKSESLWLFASIFLIVLFFNQDNNNDESDDAWICKRCTLENPGPAKICLACSRPKVRKLKTNLAENEDGSWICKFCTLKNGVNVGQCTACEAPKAQEVTMTSAVSENKRENKLVMCSGKTSNFLKPVLAFCLLDRI